MSRSAAAASIAALILSGCATTAAPQWSSATIPLSTALPTSTTMAGKSADGASTFASLGPDDTFICQVERPTGTNIAYRTCRSVTRMVRDKSWAQDTVRDLTRKSGQAGRPGYE
jgi:hypothetical protein